MRCYRLVRCSRVQIAWYAHAICRSCGQLHFKIFVASSSRLTVLPLNISKPMPSEGLNHVSGHPNRFLKRHFSRKILFVHYSINLSIASAWPRRRVHRCAHKFIISRMLHPCWGTYRYIPLSLLVFFVF